MGACHPSIPRIKSRNFCGGHLGLAITRPDLAADILMPAVIPISQDGLPKFITPDEHKQLTASTPSSFGDIPPVLQHKEESVQVTFDPPIPDLGSDEKGTLYVIER